MQDMNSPMIVIIIYFSDDINKKYRRSEGKATFTVLIRHKEANPQKEKSRRTGSMKLGVWLYLTKQWPQSNRVILSKKITQLIPCKN